MKPERLLRILVEYARDIDPSLIRREYVEAALAPAQVRQIITDLTTQLATKHGRLLLIVSVLPAQAAERGQYISHMSERYRALYQLFAAEYLPGMMRFDVQPPINARGYTTVAIHAESCDLALALVDYAIPYVENRQRIFGTHKPTAEELRAIVDAMRRAVAGDPMPAHLTDRACNLLYDLCSLPIRQEPLAQMREPVVTIYQPPPDLPGIGHSPNGANPPTDEDTTAPLPLDHLDEDGNTTQMNGTQSTTQRIIRGLRRKRGKDDKDGDGGIRPPVPRRRSRQ